MNAAAGRWRAGGGMSCNYFEVALILCAKCLVSWSRRAGSASSHPA